FFDRAPVHVVAERNRLLQHFELAQHAHQPYGGLGRSCIRGLELSLLDGGAGRGSRTDRWIRYPEIVGALFGHTGWGREVGDLELADRGSVLEDGAIGRDLKRQLRLQPDRGAARLTDRIAFSRDHLTRSRQAEIPIPCVEWTGGPLDAEKAF